MFSLGFSFPPSVRNGGNNGNAAIMPPATPVSECVATRPPAPPLAAPSKQAKLFKQHQYYKLFKQLS